MQKADMQKRAMLIVSVAGALLLPPATALHAQTTPAAPQAQSAPAAVTAADVQAFISNPGAYIAGLPASGEALSQRIRQLLTVAAQTGQLAEMLAGLNTVGAIPGITPQQLAAIVAGANAAAADLAAAQNLDAQRAIQVAVATNPALSGAQQALALATPQTTPATADLGPAGGLTAGGAPATSAIGGAGSATGGGTGGSSATSTGTGSAAAGGTGIASGSGSFSGATTGGGSGRSTNGSSGSSPSVIVDTSPTTRI
jgi:hypothetical protein